MNTVCLEPIGSNCEVGFVLNSLGNNRPSLFRWTAIDAAGFAKLLDNNFVNCYERSTVRPHTPKMVVSEPYQWAFHSALHSSPEGEFTASGNRLARLFEIERARVLHAIEIFRSRLKKGGVVATFSTPVVHDQDAIVILAAIDRFSGHGTNRVLMVGPPSEDQLPPGEICAISNRASRGAVAWLAAYDQADNADYGNWRRILAQMVSE